MHEIVTLVDLELDLVLFLDSFCVPKDPEYPTADANEICISDDSDCKDSIFLKYGLGELRFHSMLRYTFPVFVKKQLSRVEVCHQLVLFSSSCVEEMRTVSTENFRVYICSKFGVKECSELGISLNGSLKHDLLTLNHVNRSQHIPSIFQVRNVSEEVPTIRHSIGPVDEGNDTKTGKRLKMSAESYRGCDFTKLVIPSSHLFPPEHRSTGASQIDLKLNKTKYLNKFIGEEIPYSDFESCLPMLSCQNISNYDIGRWGEALVYQYLLSTQITSSVTWLNATTETKAFYDILLETKKQGLSTTRFIEVKTTTSRDKNVFELSPWEYDFLSSHPRPNYDIYRVYGAPASTFIPRIVVYRDVFQLLQEKSVSLCMCV
jgi:hypothetical protein